MSRSILVTETTSALGGALARALADSGHRVCAGVDPASGGYRQALEEHDDYRKLNGVLLTGVELALDDQRSAVRSVGKILAQDGRIDAVVHTTGCATTGPAECFTAFNLAQIVDWIVLRAHRVHRAVLPSLRAARSGRVVWLGISGGTIGAACEAMNDRLATGFADELAPFGIDFQRITVDAHDGATPVLAADDLTTAADYPLASPVTARTPTIEVVNDVVRLMGST
jgi:NAD(P)-dependent dehydrogenase (short-subunit alcohol dehydrogenase family)